MVSLRNLLSLGFARARQAVGWASPQPKEEGNGRNLWFLLFVDRLREGADGRPP